MTTRKQRGSRIEFRFSLAAGLSVVSFVCIVLQLVRSENTRFQNEVKAVSYLEGSFGGIFFCEDYDYYAEGDGNFTPVWDWSEFTSLKLYRPVFEADLSCEDNLSQLQLEQCYELSRLGKLRLTYSTNTSGPHFDFSKFKKLTELTIENTKISVGELRTIAELPSLRALSLTSCSLDDVEISRLKGLALKRLNLRGNEKLADKGITNLVQSMPSLESLIISGTCFAGDLEIIASQKSKVKNLSISQTNVTPKTFKKVCEFFPNLTYLSASDTKIDDSCVPDILKLNELSKLRVDQTELSEAGLEAIERSGILIVGKVGARRVKQRGVRSKNSDEVSERQNSIR